MAAARRRFWLAVLAALALCSGLYFMHNRRHLEFPPSREVVLDSPCLVRDGGNFRYILDRQRTRILVVDRATNVVDHVLPPRGRQRDGFTYADDFLVDSEGNVYVKEGEWDGNRISREAVIVYDAGGNYVSTHLDTRHDAIVNKHKMMLLSAGGGKIRFALKEADFVRAASLDVAGGAVERTDFPFEDAFNFVGDMALSDDGSLFMLDKAGRLYRLSEGAGPELVFSAGDDEFPCSIEPSAGGRLLYSELYSDCVVEFDPRTGGRRRVLEGSGFVTVPPVPLGSLGNPLKGARALRRQFALLAAVAVFAVSSMALLVAAACAFFGRKMKVIRRISVYIVVIVVAVAGTITYRLTKEFSEVMRGQILAQMENMAYSVANSISPETLGSIRCAADFASEDYRRMIRTMEGVIDCRLDVNRAVYCDVFKYDPRRGAFACAYLDQAIGTYFPLTAGETEEIMRIYETAVAVRSSKDDTSASYTYVSVPVVDGSGRVCGVVSVMTENCMLSDQIDGMTRRVLLGLVVTLIFVWLLMGEALSFILSKSQSEMEARVRAASGEAAAAAAFPHHYVRLVVFALFAAYNMTTTFLPTVVARGALESLGVDEGSFAAALPISVNLLAIGLMALFCEGLIRRAGCRNVVVLGAALSAASNLLVFAFPLSYATLFAALVIDGIGVGLTTNSLYLMVSRIPDAKDRASGYAAYNAAQVSGINFGMLAGAALAANVGRQLVFPLVSAMWLLSALLVVVLRRTLGLGGGAESEGTSPRRRGVPRALGFLLRRRVWSFILLVQVPFALMGGFVYYYLPLYSDTHGLGEVSVAAMMMLYSFFAIYLGDGLAKWVMRMAGRLSQYAPIALCAAAVVVYALVGSLLGLLAAVFVLGLANGFGRTVQQTRFSMLPEASEFGLSDAMGVFNFTDFIGQSVGPTVMVFVFMPRGGGPVPALVFALALALLCAGHAALNLRGRGQVGN